MLLAWALCVWLAVARHRPVQAALFGLLLLGGLLLLLRLHRCHSITIYDTSLGASASLAGEHRVPFSAIVASRLHLSRVHPVWLTVYTREPGPGVPPALVVPLKPYRRSDVLWLLDQPVLKLREPAPPAAPPRTG